MTEGRINTRQRLFSPIIQTVVAGILSMPDMERLSKHLAPRFGHATVWIIEAFELERLDKGPRESFGEFFQRFKQGGGVRVVFFSADPVINLTVSRLAHAAGLSMPAVRNKEEYYVEIMKIPESPPPKA